LGQAHRLGVCSWQRYLCAKRTTRQGGLRMQPFKVFVEKHQDGYVAYPLRLKGVIVGQEDTYEEALADVKSAIRFHIESFGAELFESDSPVLEAFVAETGIGQ
jgi:predicted RNase H-like HicB family nuclease